MKEEKLFWGRRYLFGILGLLLCAGIYFLKIPHAATVGTVPVEATELYSQVPETLQLVNQYRTGCGASPLTVDAKLTDIAMTRAFEELALFDHARPNGTSIYKMTDDAGFDSTVAVGEVIAGSISFTGATAAKVGVDTFLGSAEHASIIRARDYSYIGIGIARSEVDGIHTWCYVLASKPMSGSNISISSDRRVIKDIEVNEKYAALKICNRDTLMTFYPLAYGESGRLHAGLGFSQIGGGGTSAPIPSERLTFSSSNPSVLQVNPSTGDYTVVGTGNVTITAALPNGIKGTYAASVSPLDIRQINTYIDGKATKDSNGYTLSASNFNYTYSGKEIKPVITASLSNGKKLTEGVDYTVSYSTTENTGTSRITAKAIVTGKGNFTGTYQISYYINPDPDMVNPKVQSVSISFSGGQKSSYVSGQECPTLNVTASPGNATVTGFKWTTDAAWVSLDTDSTGKTCTVKPAGTSEGTATVTVTSIDNPSVSSSVKVVFKAPVVNKPIEEEPPVKVYGIVVTLNSTVEAGSTVKATASVHPSNAANRAVTWSSNNPSVATVDGNGNVMGISPGTATIMATAVDGSGIRAGRNIEVTAKKITTVKVSSIALSLDSRLEVGATTRAYATVSPSNASNKTLNWSSSNTSVATVDGSGNVRGINPGKVTITAAATDGSGVKASKTVEVYLNLKTPSVSAANTSSGIQVKWGTSTSANGYYIYRRSGKGKWAKIATVKGSSVNSYTDKKAKNGTLYYYTVRSYRGSTTSSYNKTGKPAYRLTNIKLSSISNKKGKKLYVKWSRNKKATGYQIQYSTNRSFYGAKTKRVKGGSKSSYTLTKLTKGKIYYVRVRAYYSKGSVKSYTSWSSFRAVKIRK